MTYVNLTRNGKIIRLNLMSGVINLRNTGRNTSELLWNWVSLDKNVNLRSLRRRSKKGKWMKGLLKTNKKSRNYLNIAAKNSKKITSFF